MSQNNSDSDNQNNPSSQNTQSNQNNDTHQGSNTNDPRVNVTDNPELQQPVADNPVSQRRSRTPTEDANTPNMNNELHGNRPKVARQGSEDHN